MKSFQQFVHRGAPQRGVAKVNVIWLISLVVLLIFALILFFSANSEKGGFKQLYEDAERARITAKSAEDATSRQISELSRAIGWYVPDAPIPVTNPVLIADSIEEAKQTFPDAGASVNDLEKLLPVITQAYTTRTREVQQLKDQNATLTSERTTLDKSLREVIQTKETELANLRRQLDDAQQTASRTIAGLETQISSSRSQIGTLESTLRDARSAMEEEKRSRANAEIEFTSRVSAMSKSIAFLKEPEAADGSLLAVSKGAQMGWIDIGANQRVAAGTRFRVVSGTLGSATVKCIAEVTRTEPTRSEVLFTQIADKFNPPVVGDVIYNPLLDPRGQRNAVLVGRFALPSENEVRGLLANMGITLQAKLDNTTDYLIVGGEMYVDEDGNALEEPLQPSETAVYKDAESKGVAITPLKDLRAYFKF
jgi:hypothetical protein